MARQPYIPLYIGDWEQDVNGLSIEAEGAWLKVIFKCWRNEGSFTATVDIMARVCKVTPEKFVDILLEWEIGNICEITRHDNGLITLASRRILRDREISKERQIAGQKSAAKRQQKANKTSTNSQQIHEYDNDNVNEVDNGIKERVQGKPLKEIEAILEHALDEIYIDQEQIKWPHLDFNFELETFKNKVRGAPDDYTNRDKGGIRHAFQYQLRNSKGKPKNGSTAKDKSTEHLSGLMAGFKRRNGGADPGW